LIFVKPRLVICSRHAVPACETGAWQKLYNKGERFFKSFPAAAAANSVIRRKAGWKKDTRASVRPAATAADTSSSLKIFTDGAVEI